MTLRFERPEDIEAILAVNAAAFGRPDEALLVDALQSGEFVRLSAVAEIETQVVGHVLFTDLPIHTDNGVVSALSLAPVAVLPAFQRRGIGSELIRHGLNQCRNEGHRIVIVLGEPQYYGRFGFTAELTEALDSPFKCPEWMALELVPEALQGVHGRAEYAAPFFNLS